MRHRNITKSRNTYKASLRRDDSDKPYDYKLFLVFTLLTIWGGIMVYSGSVIAAARQGKVPYHYFLQQVLWIIIGTTLGYIAYRVKYTEIAKLSILGIAGTMFFLILVLVLNFDNDIKRWIPIGPFTFQPSELAKLTFFIYLSSWLAKKQTISSSSISKTASAFQNHLFHELFPFLPLLGGISLPILIQPDMDTTILIVLTSFIVYFISGSSYIHLFTSVGLVGIFTLAGSILASLADYRIDRVLNWLGFWTKGAIQDPFGSGYQLRQILVAVASGGFWGLGFGESRQKFHYLGETAFTDTIFAIFAEEYGLIGSVMLILIFLFILFRGYKIASLAPDKLASNMAIAITTWITLQALLHIASNIAMIPINGNTLPFFSYGGSSTIINFIAVGILLNISKYVKSPLDKI